MKKIDLKYSILIQNLFVFETIKTKSNKMEKKKKI